MDKRLILLEDILQNAVIKGCDAYTFVELVEYLKDLTKVEEQ